MSAAIPTLDHPFRAQIAGPDEARAVGSDYVEIVGKVIASHVRNELAGATVFDEPAIALAPSPREKWLACRIAMEEYGHHLKFSRLARELDIPDPMPGRSLSVFDYQLTTWTQFVVLKAIVDLAEVVLMEELAESTYLPLRDLAIRLLPEELFHVSFGKSMMRELAKDPTNRPELQQAVNDLVAFTLPFFGRSVSANNERYRQWGVKRTSNDAARAEFIARSRSFVIDEMGLTYPAVAVTWDG